jgi:hypothetical protein
VMDDALDGGVLIGLDFICLRIIAVAIPGVEKYLSKAVISDWMDERIPVGERIFFKDGWGFDE